LEEVEMKSIAVLGISLAVATLLAGPVAAQAQTAEPTPYHRYQIHRYHGPHHTVHHHFVAHAPAPGPTPVVAAPPPATQAAPLGLSWPHIAPYPDNKGDEDGLSGDTDDCNKGCVDGAPD
jgi:hypothetical protein